MYCNYGMTKRNVDSSLQTLKVRQNTGYSTFHVLCGLRYKCETVNLGKCALHLELKTLRCLHKAAGASWTDLMVMEVNSFFDPLRLLFQHYQTSCSPFPYAYLWMAPWPTYHLHLHQQHTSSTTDPSHHTSYLSRRQLGQFYVQHTRRFLWSGLF